MGVTLLDISEAAEQIGLHSLGAKTDTQELKTAPLPCILHWKQKHFIVLYKVKNDSYYIADSLSGKIKLSEREFLNNWTVSNNEESGIGLFLRATPKFYQLEDDGAKKLNWSFITKYLFSYKRLLLQIVLALTIGTVLQLIAPFLTQSIVDVGIGTNNLNFIQLILIAQVMIFIGSTSVDFIRSWILLHISTRLNIAILTDLLALLFYIPLC
jgi:ATP-binding cassette subfamily B protein